MDNRNIVRLFCMLDFDMPRYIIVNVEVVLICGRVILATRIYNTKANLKNV